MSKEGKERKIEREKKEMENRMEKNITGLCDC